MDTRGEMTHNTAAALIVLILATAPGCGDGPRSPSIGQTWNSFEGSWNASGARQTLHLGPGHQASIVGLSGNLSVATANLGTLGFRAEAIAFSDDARGMMGYAVWTDERGDQVFSELKGEKVGTGNRVTGTISGGTGRYAHVTGEYEFQWQYVIAAEEGAVQGRAVGLKGRVRREDTGAGPGPPGGQKP